MITWQLLVTMVTRIVYIEVEVSFKLTILKFSFF